MTTVIAHAPGRVNLIGDHTDYTGGLCFPIAVDRGVTVTGRRTAQRWIELDAEGYDALRLDLDAATSPGAVEPEWGRFVAGVAAELRPPTGFAGTVTSDLPVGAGLSSSAALEVAVALAIGAEGLTAVELARLCQRAEHAARGVRTGLLDQLASIGGVAGHGLLIDCRALTVSPVPLPSAEDAEWIVVHTGSRSIAASQYDTRVDELAAVEAEIGPLRDAAAADVDTLGDPVLRSRARHVVNENARVLDFADAIGDDLAAAGALMSASHRSLRDDYESSTPFVDEVWARLVASPGVYGARVTGAGWGGCIVACAAPGAVDLDDYRHGGLQAWRMTAADGAGVIPGDRG